MSDWRLQVESLAAGYGKKLILNSVSFDARAGEILCLVGPNGAGKSTLLKTLLRLIPPLAGEIRYGGRPLTELSERELARCCAAVLTGRPEPERMRCEELVAMGRYPYTGRLGVLGAEDRRVVRESMELVGVTELREESFTDISDGQRQRVLLARAICQEPRLLILDEPTSFLDIRYKLEFMELLRVLAREKGLAIVMSMHELELARLFSDRLLCLLGGGIDRIGTPEELFTGDYMERLFGVEPGRYATLFGKEAR